MPTALPCGPAKPGVSLSVLLAALVGCLGTAAAQASGVPGAGVHLYGALDIALTATDRGNGQRVTAITSGV